MYCNHCGKELPEGSICCPECGQAVGGAGAPMVESGLGKTVNSTVQTRKTNQTPIWGDSPISFVIYCSVAVIVLIGSFVAATGMASGAADMEIFSRSGTTIDEAFYQACSVFCGGVAAFIRICGVYFAGSLVGRAFKK